MVADGAIAKAITKMIDCEFALADKSRGWDCLNSLKEFYDGCGVKFPSEFEDFNESNYAEKWNYDPEIAKQTMFRFLKTLGEPIEKNYAVRGDLLILRHEMKEKPASRVREALKKLKEVHPALRRMINNMIEGKQILTFPAIYLGNGNIFMVFDKGGRVVPYRFFDKFVVEVRRLFK